MAISDELWIIALGILFIYLVVYQKNKFFGNLAFIGLSIAIMSFSTGNLFAATGLIMLTGSLVNTISDAIQKIRNK